MRRRSGNRKRRQASPSEGGEILRRKKEMMAALCADDEDLFSCTKLTAEDALQLQAGDGKARKKKKVVKQKLPLALIQYMKDTPHPTTDELSEEELAKESKTYREDYARDKFRSDKIRAYCQAIIDQYEAQGYAEDETEVTDDEEETVGN